MIKTFLIYECSERGPLFTATGISHWGKQVLYWGIIIGQHYPA